MFCLASLIVLAILSLFSASHRPLAKMALDCVVRRATFRTCNSDFKEQMQGRIVGALLRRSPASARFVHKQFELLSWIFVILSVASLAWALWGGWNFYAWGSCNGRNVSGFCVFDPKGSSNQISSITEECREAPPTEADLSITPLTIANYPSLHGSIKDLSGRRGDVKYRIVTIGDYGCDYTRKAWPVFKRLRDNVDKLYNYTFIQFPVKKETAYLSDYATCAAKIDNKKFFELSDKFFAVTKEDLLASSTALRLVAETGYDMSEFNKCLADPETKKATSAREKEVKATGLYGTPTVFINNKTPLVGPKPYRVYRRLLWGFF